MGPRLFRRLTNVTYINLRRNRLDALDYEIFKDCLKLKEINLHDEMNNKMVIEEYLEEKSIDNFNQVIE